jgi:hypothetical protein
MIRHAEIKVIILGGTNAFDQMRKEEKEEAEEEEEEEGGGRWKKVEAVHMIEIGYELCDDIWIQFVLCLIIIAIATVATNSAII